MPKSKILADACARCCLRLEVVAGPICGEPSEYVLNFDGDLVAGEVLDAVVGKFKARILEFPAAYDAGEHLMEVLDSVDACLAHFLNLIDLRTGLFKPSLERLAGVPIGRVLLLERIEIDAGERGRQLGLAAIEIACSRLGQGCVLALLRAFPLQWEGKVEEDPMQFRKDRAKLMAYYRLVGFQPVLGDGLMARAL